MVVRIELKLGAMKLVEINGERSRMSEIPYEDFTCTDIPDAIRQWQGVHSGPNTIPTNRIEKVVVIG